MSTETEDLEALFDSIAAQRQQTSQAAVETPVRAAGAPAAAAAAPAAPAPAVQAAADAEGGPDVFHRIGTLTRSLHDALRELGYDRVVENAASSLPDARDRLDYIAMLTGKAADRALAAAELGREHQDTLSAGATSLARDWDRAFAGTLSLEEFKATAKATRDFLGTVGSASEATNAQLTEIVMAQDFHDLTGQVIQRIVKLARGLEADLLRLLLETTPAERRNPVEDQWLGGPVVNGAGRDDVVTSQAQVDDLLESLGF